MRRNKPRRRSSSLAADIMTPEVKVNPKDLASGVAAGTDHGIGAQNQKDSAQHDPPAPILSSRRKGSNTQRRHRRKSTDAAENAAEPKVDSTSTAPPQQVPTSEGGTQRLLPSTGDLQTAITSGIGQYLQSLLPTKQPTAQQESLQQPPLQQPLMPQQAMQLMSMPQQALTQQTVHEASIQQQNLQQSPFLPSMLSVMPQPSYPQPNFQQATIPQTFPYPYGGVLPSWYGVPQQMHLGQAPLPYLPSTAIQPASMAAAAPAMLQDVPPSVSAVPAASLEPAAAAGPPEVKQPAEVIDHALPEPGTAPAVVPVTQEANVAGVEPVADASRRDSDVANRLSPTTFTDLPNVTQSEKKSRPSHRRQSRRRVAVDEGAVDAGVASPPSRTSRAESKAYISKAPRKHRSYSSLSYPQTVPREDQFDEKDGRDPAFASDHRSTRHYSAQSQGGEEQVDELTEDVMSPPMPLKSPPRSKGKSRARAARQRKSVAAAPEPLPASSAREDSSAETDLSREASTSSAGPATTNVSTVDKEILKKLIGVLAARRQAPSLPISPSPEQEQECKVKCHHRGGLGKDRHHEKKEREHDNSEDFFEEIVEEIVEPEKGEKGGPKKRLVRKTTKMRTHNVTEEPCRDERGESNALPLVDRVQAMRSRFSGAKRSPSDKPCWSPSDNSEDDNSGPTETASRQNGRNRSLPDWHRTADYDEQEDSTEFEPEPLPLRAGQRYFRPPFTRQPVPPWYRAPFAPRYSPRAAMMPRPYRLFRPIPCFDCATMASHFPRPLFNRDVCPFHALPTLHTCPNAGTCADQRPCCHTKTCGCVQAPGLNSSCCPNATLATNQCMSTDPSPPLPPGSASTKQASRPRRVVYRSCPPPPGLPVIDNTCWSTGTTWVAGPGNKDAPCGCCQGQSAAIDDLGQRQLSLEEVLRHEDSIRLDAQLEDRRRLLDEERIRDEERLAFREYLSQQDQVLNDDARRLSDTQLQEFKEALQRELAKRRDAKAKLGAARSQATGNTAPQVSPPSSGQARLATEVKAKEPSMPGALKLDPGKQGCCASRRSSRPSLQLGTARRASFAPALETIAGPPPSSAAGVDSTKTPASK